MKKLFHLFTLLILSFTASAQQIDSIVMVPSNPSAVDPINFYIYLSFPQGGCVDVAHSSVNGNDIYGNSFHCMGMIMSVCYDVDTIQLSPLSPGNYTFYYSLDAGFGPPGNCTPGFLPYDYDTIQFNVSTVLGVETTKHVLNYSVFPNPASNEISISNIENTTVELSIINNLGQTILSERLEPNTNKIDISNFAPGIYFFLLQDAEGFTSYEKINISR
ncbi:hypothetical protein BH09BAC5_BH09BAC5_02250 [soil metagenome]